MMLSLRPPHLLEGMLLLNDVNDIKCGSKLNKSTIIEISTSKLSEVLIEETRFDKEYEISMSDLEDTIKRILLNSQRDDSIFPLMAMLRKGVGDNFNQVYRNLLDLKNTDEITFQHSVDVAWLSMYLGYKLSLDKITISKLTLAALLHDIGKLYVSKDILNKNDKLSNSEYVEVKKHSIYGEQALRDIIKDFDIRNMILSHHEYLDGSGYPNKLCLGDINMTGHIITVCDIFSALIEKRVYRNEMSSFKAFNILLKEASYGKLCRKYVDLFRYIIDLLGGTKLKVNDRDYTFLSMIDNNKLKVIKDNEYKILYLNDID